MMMPMVFRDDHDDVAMPGVPMPFMDLAAAQHECCHQRHQEHECLIHS
jgi:hypothetical protein